MFEDYGLSEYVPFVEEEEAALNHELWPIIAKITSFFLKAESIEINFIDLDHVEAIGSIGSISIDNLDKKISDLKKTLETNKDKDKIDENTKLLLQCLFYQINLIQMNLYQEKEKLFSSEKLKSQDAFTGFVLVSELQKKLAEIVGSVCELVSQNPILLGSIYKAISIKIRENPSTKKILQEAEKLQARIDKIIKFTNYQYGEDSSNIGESFKKTFVLVFPAIEEGIRNFLSAQNIYKNISEYLEDIKNKIKPMPEGDRCVTKELKTLTCDQSLTTRDALENQLQTERLKELIECASILQRKIEIKKLSLELKLKIFFFLESRDPRIDIEIQSLKDEIEKLFIEEFQRSIEKKNIQIQYLEAIKLILNVQIEDIYLEALSKNKGGLDPDIQKKEDDSRLLKKEILQMFDNLYSLAKKDQNLFIKAVEEIDLDIFSYEEGEEKLLLEYDKEQEHTLKDIFFIERDINHTSKEVAQKELFGTYILDCLKKRAKSLLEERDILEKIFEKIQAFEQIQKQCLENSYDFIQKENNLKKKNYSLICKKYDKFCKEISLFTDLLKANQVFLPAPDEQWYCSLFSYWNSYLMAEIEAMFSLLSVSDGRFKTMSERKNAYELQKHKLRVLQKLDLNNNKLTNLDEQKGEIVEMKATLETLKEKFKEMSAHIKRSLDNSELRQEFNSAYEKLNSLQSNSDDNKVVALSISGPFRDVTAKFKKVISNSIVVDKAESEERIKQCDQLREWYFIFRTNELKKEFFEKVERLGEYLDQVNTQTIEQEEKRNEEFNEEFKALSNILDNASIRINEEKEFLKKKLPNTIGSIDEVQYLTSVLNRASQIMQKALGREKSEHVKETPSSVLSNVSQTTQLALKELNASTSLSLLVEKNKQAQQVKEQAKKVQEQANKAQEKANKAQEQAKKVQEQAKKVQEQAKKVQEQVNKVQEQMAKAITQYEQAKKKAEEAKTSLDNAQQKEKEISNQEKLLVDLLYHLEKASDIIANIHPNTHMVPIELHKTINDSTIISLTESRKQQKKLQTQQEEAKKAVTTAKKEAQATEAQAKKAKRQAKKASEEAQAAEAQAKKAAEEVEAAKEQAKKAAEEAQAAEAQAKKAAEKAQAAKEQEKKAAAEVEAAKAQANEQVQLAKEARSAQQVEARLAQQLI